MGDFAEGLKVAIIVIGLACFLGGAALGIAAALWYA